MYCETSSRSLDAEIGEGDVWKHTLFTGAPVFWEERWLSDLHHIEISSWPLLSDVSRDPLSFALFRKVGYKSQVH